MPRLRQDSVRPTSFPGQQVVILTFWFFVLVAVWAAVDQGLSDRIAKAVGAPTVKPLAVKPASEVANFRANFIKSF